MVEIEIVSSGPELVSRALELRPLVVITDGSMPNRGDGLCAALQIQEALQTHFILFTADDPEDWPLNFPGEIVSKFDSSELRETILRAIRP
ncbi:MAG: hypothetical protein UT22_C0033G0013 [Parcubacteria group bacterium GW2011_GWC2_39_11]|nr:MAG: hypothetical protein UT22_C0033G0013 [Parcubacteria group bacterium GW2011_GWC2_39_11]